MSDRAPSLPWRAQFARVATRRSFRLAFAALLVLTHVLAYQAMGTSRFGLPLNAAPGQAPYFDDVTADLRSDTPLHWDRLLMSRWDSQHYMNIALRGFSQCPRGDLKGPHLLATLYKCDFHFFPAYSLVARAVSLGGRIPIDYAMWLVALTSSFIFFFLWTGPTLTRSLGLGATYGSLLLLNVAPSASTFVSLLTEPTVLALSLGSFIALASRQYVLGAVLAGAATGVRVSGASLGPAYAAALLASLHFDRPTRVRAWASRLLALPLAGWGLVAMFAYYAWMYADPFLYMHSHAVALPRDSSRFASLIGAPFMRFALNSRYAEIVWIVLFILWFTLGHGAGLRRFPPVERIFWYVFAVFAITIPLVGTWELGWTGMNRYWLFVMPVYFAMAKVLARRPLALAFWVTVSAWAYWNVELCDFIAQREGSRMCF